jgi:uncharacterized protein (DUF433 family)
MTADEVRTGYPQLADPDILAAIAFTPRRGIEPIDVYNRLTLRAV